MLKNNDLMYLLSSVHDLRTRSLYKEVKGGTLTRLLELDVPTMVRDYNNGDKFVLATDECQEFINSTITIKELYSFIITCENILSRKEEFLQVINDQKDQFIYNPNERVLDRNRRNSTSYSETYQEVLDTISLAEQVVNSKSTYQLLKLLIRYEKVRPELKQRKKVLEVLQTEDERREKLKGLIETKDNELGIVRIVTSNSRPTIKAGTKKDMAISDILGLPYPKDEEREGYEYGPHGDYYMQPYSCHKEFHIDDLTPSHYQMIAEERQKRDAMASSFIRDEEGYIYSNGVALPITKEELLRNGIDPNSVGWKPFKVSLERPKLFSLKRDANDYKLSIGEQIRIKMKSL